jgi:hypothetical protein
VTIRNTILSAHPWVGPDCRGGIESLGYNLIRDPRDCTISGDQTGNLTLLDPRFHALGLNGGPTRTHALRPDSPAIDAGDPGGCTDAGGAPLTTDQRGAPRPVDGGGGLRCDMGAFEFASVPPSTFYISTDASDVTAPGHAVESALISPFRFEPEPEPELYFQLDDGTGWPQQIRVVKDLPDLVVWY